MTWLAAFVGVPALVLASLRWLRASQREHYIPGSCVAVARRWIARRPPNALLAALAAVAALVAVAAAVSGAEGIALASAAVAAVTAVSFPFPMSILGRDVRIRFTRRAKVLALASVVLAVVVVALAALVGAAAVAPAVLAVASPLLVDAAAALVSPFERRAMEKHQRRAEARLRSVAPRVVAVTGSWGKTSTKAHVRDLLAGSYEVVASPASWNNTGGLSRTLNEHVGDGCEVLVAEMGMYGRGEISALCSWLHPEVSVICSVGPMHLERVGSMEGIVAAKAEILEGARAAVLWVDDPPLRRLADHFASTGREVWRVGTVGAEAADRDDVALDVAVFTTGAGEVEVEVRGERLGAVPSGSDVHAGNVGCAVAAALALGAPGDAVARRLPTLHGPPKRAAGGRSESGVWVIDDTFNANPVGALAALDALVAASPGGRRAVVTPGLVELGPLQEQENRDLAEAVVAADATIVVVGWTNRRALCAGAAGGSVVVVADRQEARDWVRRELSEGDAVLWENDLPDHYP